MDSLSQRKGRWAKSMVRPRSRRGFQRVATDSPWQMELVATKAARVVGDWFWQSKAFLNQAVT